MCLPLWIVIVLVVAAFVTGCLVYRNNAKEANAKLAALVAKAALAGIKL